MPFRAESSSFRAYSARKLTEKSEKTKTAYRLVQIEPNSICCYFIIWKGCFFRNTNKMGRRSTALPPEKSKSLRVLCEDAWVISSFCICTLPCTLSSVSFLCRKPGRESCRLPVYKEECRCCGSPARFFGSLSAGMPLPCPSAVHRHKQTVVVSPTTFRAGPTACRNSSGMPLPTRGSFL